MAFKKPSVHKIQPDIKNASIYLRGQAKIGKEIPDSEPILTEYGWTPMGKIKVGDRVYGEDGKLHNVLGVFPQGKKDVYEITLNDGSKVRSGEEHLWGVYLRDSEDDELCVLELKDMIKDYVSSDKNKKHRYKYALPLVSPIDFSEIKPETEENSRLFVPVEKRVERIGSILAKGNIFKERFVELYNESNVKSFVELKNTRADRLADLCRSVGLLAYVRPLAHCRKSIFVKTPNLKDRYIVDIEKLDYQEESTCIFVDSPSHLFVMKDFVPTHNTTLFRDVVLEKFGDPERGLLVKCGAECGDTMVDEVNSVQIEEWQDVIDLVNWLVETRGKEHDIEIIGFDTVDELVKMAEVEAMKISYKESREAGKPLKPRSINQAFGGYGKGQAYAVNNLLTPVLSKLKSRFGLWAIAHTAMKTMTNSVDSLNTDVAVQQLTSNLDKRYEALFSGLFDVIVTGAFENEAIVGTAKKGNKDVELVDATKQTRRLYFRSTAFVDSGSRFADYSDMPESMEYKLNENNAKTFIELVEYGMEHSKLKYRQNNNTEKKPEPKAEKPEMIPAQDDLPIEEPEETTDDEISKEELFKKVAAKFAECKDKAVKKQIKEVSGGSVNKETSVETLKQILELLDD